MKSHRNGCRDFSLAVDSGLDVASFAFVSECGVNAVVPPHNRIGEKGGSGQKEITGEIVSRSCRGCEDQRWHSVSARIMRSLYRSAGSSASADLTMDGKVRFLTGSFGGNSEARASPANWSARSLSGSPVWPLTKNHLTLWRSISVLSCSHNSRFLTGLPSAVSHPFDIQFVIRYFAESFRYSESVISSTSHGRFSSRSPIIAAVISIELFVASATAPDISRT